MSYSNLCINEFMTDLFDKIKGDDPTTSQICAFMVGLMQCPWEKIKSASLDWKAFEILDEKGYKTVIKPEINIVFK